MAGTGESRKSQLTGGSAHRVWGSCTTHDRPGPEDCMTRREPKIRDTRDRVLSAALEVFAAKGFASTSVDKIVERAGCTRGAFYYYFESKEDIARDLQRDLWRRLAQRAQEAFDPDLGTIENLKRAFHVHLETLSELGEARFFLREGFLDQIGRAHV